MFLQSKFKLHADGCRDDEDKFGDIVCRDKKQNTYMFCCCEDSWAASICEARALGTVTNIMLDYVVASGGDGTPAKWTGATSLYLNKSRKIRNKVARYDVTKQSLLDLTLDNEVNISTRFVDQSFKKEVQFS